MKKFINLLILSVAVTSFSSCLKDDNANLTEDNSPAVVEWSTTTFVAPTATNAGYTLYTKSFELVAAANLELNVNYTGGEAAPEDVTVGLDLNTAAIATYNTASGDHFEVLPSTLYTLPASVVIPKGQRSAKVTIALKPNQFDLTKAYVLPLRIKSLSSGTISGNYGTIFVNVGAKNKYDGIYTLTGTFTDANGVYGGTYPSEVQLITVDATTVDLYWSDYGNYYYILTNLTTGGAANGGATRFKFDPTTDKVISITNRSNAAFGTLVAGGPNQYTTADHKFVINYTFPTSNRFKANDVYTYKGAR